MNDEIKVLLDYLKDEKWEYYPSDMTPYKVLVMEERDLLLDYITNLQQENERLKEQSKKDNHILGCNFASKDKYKQRYEDYKSRCKKASGKLSFIDKALENDTLNVPLCIVKINSALNILQGSENNV